VEAVFGVPGVGARLEPMVTWPRWHDVVVKPSMVFELTQPVESFGSYVCLGELGVYYKIVIQP
jgi:hypothetical protein